jgi:3-oxoacyl-[acyl-carrier-protein] synthase-3
MAAASKLAGLGHYAPERRVSNGEIEERMGLEPGWIERRTGIRERRYAADSEALTDMAVQAGDMALQAAGALQSAGLSRTDVALVLLATSTPDHLLPPSAPLLAHRLGLGNAGGIDMAGACAGFLYALVLADGFVRAQGKPVLVVAANVLSRRTNRNERASCILFSDAAGAALLMPSNEPGAGVLGAQLATDGASYGLIQIPAGGSRQPFAAGTPIEETLMTIRDGKAVFVRAVEMMVRASREALAQAGLSVADIDLFVPHQANARIMSAVAEKLGIADEKMFSTVADFANSSAATIPFTLAKAAEAGRLQKGAKILMCAAGAGLTGGAVVLAV